MLAKIRAGGGKLVSYRVQDAGNRGKKVWDVGLSIIESFLEAPFANTNAKIQSFCLEYKNLICYDAKHRYLTEEEKVAPARH